MVRGNLRNNKWMRRYRLFFIIGFAILSMQIFLAARFLSINRNQKTQEYHWQPSNLDNESDQEVESNSAGKNKVDNVDDEDTLLSSRNKRNRMNQTHSLRYEDLDFAPTCNINVREAISAINRAKTQSCKQLISNITCLSNSGELYPVKLKGFCPADGFLANKELGCFKDEKNYRLLSGYFGINKKSNSPNYCIKLCLQSGFPYAGVQYSNECFCGTDEPPLSSKMPDSSCNFKCPGDSHATCGGYYTINIYQTGIKRFTPQTAITEVASKPVKIVFLLTLNGRAVRQVKRLLKILYHRDHYYYIHVDIRQDYMYRELMALEKVLPNVRLTRKRFATIWGGASLLEMLRSCMWELRSLHEWSWDFVLNLSESDFPVKTVKHLTEFLSSNKNRNFVKSHGREVQRFIQKQGLDKTFVECENRMWRVGDRTLPFGIQVDGGSDWIALSRKFVEYVANPHPDELISGLLRIFKYTLLPAESFFHTALRNSKFCDSYIDNNLHVTNWKRKLGCKCQYKHVVDWCGCSPNDFLPEDWPRILNTVSRQLFFARKFEPIINQAIILQVELWLHDIDQPSRQVENLNSYWQSIYNFRDLGIIPDDGLLTIADSIKRNVIETFSKTNSSCDPKLGILSQIHSYHNSDNYKYTLFNYESAEQYSLEVAVKPRNHITVAKSSLLMENLESITISTDYDQKEQLSRNFLGILTPMSEPVLIYKFKLKHSSKTYNMTSLWIGPSGTLYDAVDFSLDEASATGHVKPSLRNPVLPGIWAVKLLYKNTVLAEVKFLVIPLSFSSGSTIKISQATLLNGGQTVLRDFKNSFEKFIPNSNTKETLARTAQENSKKIGKSLEYWIDDLISTFYQVHKICVHLLSAVSLCGVPVEACVKTDWSSFAPDPKSAISPINETTGSFNIW